MHIVAKGLHKSFGENKVVKDVSFEIEKGKLIGLLGPSGGGKTTILRMLAGLEEPDSGDVLFNGERMNGVPAGKRGIGFVFQNYALFRHMSVFDNIAFGLTVRKEKKRVIRETVEKFIHLTGLTGLESRLPSQLSGGQRQRVAFARALAPGPELLLLDEPFAAIDAKVRKELRNWLKEMIARVGVTTIFVTHDQEEAVEVADEMMIVSHGRLEQKGSPLSMYREPQTPFVAGFVGESNRLDGTDGLKGFETAMEDAGIEVIDEIAANGSVGGTKGTDGAGVIIRPEFIEIGSEHEVGFPSAAQEGVVRNTFFRGRDWQVEVEVGHHRLFAYRPVEKKALKAGDRVLVLIHRVYVFASSGRPIVAENRLKADSAVEVSI